MTRLQFILLGLIIGTGGRFAAVACSHSYPQADSQAISDAKNLCAFAYSHADGGALSADVRACYCALGGIQLRNNLAGDDAGIRCQ
jgi:hypothetical protein